MRTSVCTLLLVAVVSLGLSDTVQQEREKSTAILLWQKSLASPKGRNAKSDLVRQVCLARLRVETLVPDGVIASGRYGTPETSQRMNGTVFNMDNPFAFQGDVLVVGFTPEDSTIPFTEGDKFQAILYPCGTYAYRGKTLKRYATTPEKAWELLTAPESPESEIARLEADKKKIEDRLTELRKQQEEKAATK